MLVSIFIYKAKHGLKTQHFEEYLPKICRKESECLHSLKEAKQEEKY